MTAGPTLGTAVARARARLAAAGIAAAGLDARLLAAHVFGCGVGVLIGHPERPIDPAAAARFEVAVGRRLAHEPLAYILGGKEFWSLSLRVTSDTLIPRPETEAVVEAALEWCRRGGDATRILDLGTGSGCLLLALLTELPAAWGVGVDRSEPALAVARGNAERLGIAERASFVCADWATAVAGEFDVVVCNPPYVADAEWSDLPPDVGEFEPSLALRARRRRSRRLSRHLSRSAPAAGAERRGVPRARRRGRPRGRRRLGGRRGYAGVGDSGSRGTPTVFAGECDGAASM